MNVIGTDVSHWQDSKTTPYPDWQSAKGQLQFASVKISDGQQPLPPAVYAESQYDWVQAGEIELARMGMHYYHSRAEAQSPIKQAENFFEAFQNLVLAVSPDKMFGEMGACTDVESNDQHLVVNQFRDQLEKYLERFRQLSGLYSMIYTRALLWNTTTCMPRCNRDPKQRPPGRATFVATEDQQRRRSGTPSDQRSWN